MGMIRFKTLRYSLVWSIPNKYRIDNRTRIPGFTWVDLDGSAPWGDISWAI